MEMHDEINCAWVISRPVYDCLPLLASPSLCGCGQDC